MCDEGTRVAAEGARVRGANPKIAAAGRAAHCTQRAHHHSAQHAPCCSSQWLTVNCVLLIRQRAASGPRSIHVTCTSPPPCAPSVFLHTLPVTSAPSTMSTCESSLEKPSSSGSLYHCVFWCLVVCLFLFGVGCVLGFCVCVGGGECLFV